MRIRALGTGSKFCRTPLSPPSFVVETGKDIILIGAPWTISTTFSVYAYDIDRIAMIVLHSSTSDQIGGLVDLAWQFSGKQKKPILAGPADLLQSVQDRLDKDLDFPARDAFHFKAVTKIMLKEEFFSETIIFVPSYRSTALPSYALRFESAEVFLTGEVLLNEDWLYKEMTSEVILHMCRTDSYVPGCAPLVSEISELPSYLLSRIWLYGYEASTKEQEQPFPMLYLPRGAIVFDSGRRDKLLSKTRYISENSRKC